MKFVVIYTSRIHWVARFRGGLEHLKIETRLIDERFASVMGECVIVTLKVRRLYQKVNPKLSRFLIRGVFLITDKTKASIVSRGGGQRCRCYARRRAKA